MDTNHDESTESNPPKDFGGTPEYLADTQGPPADTAGYPEKETEHGAHDDAVNEPETEWHLDLDIYLEPREVADRKLVANNWAIAHDGKEGWAYNRKTGKLDYIKGEPQWDVVARDPYEPRDEPGLTDLPAEGGLPSHVAAETVTGEAGLSDLRERRRVQIGLKLSRDQAAELEQAAELFGLKRTAMARLLVVRGAREIVAKAERDS